MKFGERAFGVAGLTAWNSLPTEIRTTSSTPAFNKKLKTFLFSKSYDIIGLSFFIFFILLGLDRYHAGARYPILSAATIPIPIPVCTMYKFFVLKMRFCAGYRCVQVIYVCRVYVRKYGIGLKLRACVATVLNVETGKRMTGVGVSAPILK